MTFYLYHISANIVFSVLNANSIPVVHIQKQKILQLNPSRNQVGGFIQVRLDYLYGYSVLIKIFWSKAYLVVPVDSKTIKIEVLEIGDVTQLLAYPLIVQGSEIESLDFSCVECESQNVIRNVFCRFNVYHGISFKRVYLYETSFSFSTSPVLQQLIPVQVQPFKNQIQCPSRKRACNYTVIDGYLRSVFVILYMEVGG